MIGSVQTLIYAAFYLVIFLLAVWALIDVLRRPAGAFVSAGKRTKKFWGLLLGAAVLLAFAALPPPIGVGYLSFLALGSAIAAVVYLVDVKPAVTPYSGGRGRGPSGPRGGW
ncbi:DUF2516 family protein [Cellulomonas cellasea]|uniref:DUF2516 domain-containing protein n=1 Tax=Cellulomonas cellasea TaxID=43670 RepID=A0A7W4YAP1_9CELL|nr:DUF2516 family protein [Cellulomonas cellasea]MBB2922269.1 hypothetical protein [Cellulomonas cellasea]